MLVSNGTITRNIAADQLPEYERKGYKPVIVEEKPKAKKGVEK